jgi:predicted nucleic acid-binding Zn ribbon protein
MSNLIKCKGCGQEVSPDAKACPKCGAPVKKKTGCLMMIVYGFVGLIALAIIVSIFSGGSNKSGGESGGSAPVALPTVSNQQTAILLPQDQKAFCDAVTGFISQYNAAPNELKKSAVRVARKQKLQELLPSLQFDGWIGELTDMGTTSDGSAYIAIKLEGNTIKIQTWNNGASDIEDKTLIPVNTPLFNAISDLKEGIHVKVSGQFVAGEQDYIAEQSITENGSMTEPEFTVHFTKVEKAP